MIENYKDLSIIEKMKIASKAQLGNIFENISFEKYFDSDEFKKAKKDLIEYTKENCIERAKFMLTATSSTGNELDLCTVRMCYTQKFCEYSLIQIDFIEKYANQYIAIKNAKNTKRKYKEQEQAKPVQKQFGAFNGQINLNIFQMSIGFSKGQGQPIALKRRFNSHQEKMFFDALCLSGFQDIETNAAIKQVIEFQDISHLLTAQEKGFFHTGLIDFVLYDDESLPIACIELDSPYHDENEQQERDKMKDRIFEVVGLPFYRFRDNSENRTVERFRKAINQIFQITKN